MPLELPEPHQPHLLSSDDTLLLLRCDEASAGDAMVDAAGGGSFTDSGSVGVAGSLFASPEGSSGARSFDGTTPQLQTRSGTAGEAASLKANTLTVEMWIAPGTVSGTQKLIGYGTSGETEATNYQVLLGLSGDEIEWLWEEGAGTNVSGTTSGANLSAGVAYHVALVRAPPASGTANVCDVFIYLNGALVGSWTDQDLPTGGTSGGWYVGAQDGGANPYRGDIDDIRVSTFAATEECIRDSYARGVRDHDLSTLYDSGFYSVFARVLVEDGSGDFIDLTDLQGFDLFRGFEWTDDIDSQGVHGIVRLHRNVHGFSLSPLMVNSLLNVDAGGTALALGRRVKVETAVLPDGCNLLEAELYWQPVFHGFTVAIDYGSETIDLDVYDLHSELQDTWIEPDRTSTPPVDYQYGDPAGTAIQGEVQDLIDDQEPSAGWLAPDGHQIYVETDPGWDVLPWNVTPDQSIAQHLETAIGEFGWNFKRRFDDHRKEFRLTLYEPDRTGSWSSSDPTLRPEDIIEVRACKLDRSMIRNAIEVEYGNELSEDNAGAFERATVLVDSSYGGAVGTIASNSEAKYGRRYARVGIASSRRINNATDAAAFGERMLRDLAEPKANYEVVTHFRPYIRTGDFVKCTADDLHFDADQVFAVTMAKHTLGAGETTTTLSLRSAGPAAFVKMWFEGFITAAGYIGGDGLAPPSTPAGLTATATVGGLLIEWNFPVNHLNRRYRETEVHISTSSGFTPSDSTIVRITRGRDALVSNLDPATTYYVKVLHRDEMNNVSVASTQVSGQPVFTMPVPTFKARINLNRSATVSGWTDMDIGSSPDGAPNDDEEYDIGGNYALGSNYRFVAPVTGPYVFTIHSEWSPNASARNIGHRLVDDAGTPNQVGEDSWQPFPSGSPTTKVTTTHPVYLTAGDVVEPQVQDTLSRSILAGSFFEGHLIADNS